jgi:hypothetical protein
LDTHSSCSPYPLSYLSPICPRLSLMYIPNILHSFTSHSDVYLAPSPSLPLYSLPCPLHLIFAFLGLFMDTFLLLSLSPTIIYHILWVFVAPRSLPVPFQTLAPLEETECDEGLKRFKLRFNFSHT